MDRNQWLCHVIPIDTPTWQRFTITASIKQAIAKIFEFFSKTNSKFSRNFDEKKIDFAHSSGALARPGSRELRADKIPTSYDAWRPRNVEKTIRNKFDVFWSRRVNSYARKAMGSTFERP